MFKKLKKHFFTCCKIHATLYMFEALSFFLYLLFISEMSRLSAKKRAHQSVRSVWTMLNYYCWLLFFSLLNTDTMFTICEALLSLLFGYLFSTRLNEAFRPHYMFLTIQDNTGIFLKPGSAFPFDPLCYNFQRRATDNEK